MRASSNQSVERKGTSPVALDVAVDDSALMGKGESCGNLAGDRDETLLVEGALPLNQRGERVRVERHGEKGVLLVVTHVQDGNQVGVLKVRY
jgi:hypothetical protein